MLRILLVAFFFLAALPTSAQAGFDEGHKAYSEKNWEVAIRNLRPLAEMGDARAMVVLGNMYLDGLGVGKDLKEAFNLYRKAAIRDNPDAMVMVGALYQGGIGVKKNVRYAAEWFGRAARLGHGSGAFFYGVHLFRGNRSAPEDNYVSEFKPDHEAAYKWLRISAKRTSNEKLEARAKRDADELAKKLPADRLAVIDAEVSAWTPEVPSTLGILPEDMPPQKPEVVAPAPTPETVPEVKKTDEVSPEIKP